MFEDSSILNSIIVGAVGGGLAGLTVVGVQYLHEKFLECRDKKRVYTWMSDVITKNKDGFSYLSTKAIASYNNITEDRVRFICSIHKLTYLSTGEQEDMWGIKGLSGRKR